MCIVLTVSVHLPELTGVLYYDPTWAPSPVSIFSSFSRSFLKIEKLQMLKIEEREEEVVSLLNNGGPNSVDDLDKI